MLDQAQSPDLLAQEDDPICPGPEGIDAASDAGDAAAAGGGIHTEYPCDSQNYRKGRTQAITYLVVHYVGATGSARGNAIYFHTHHAASLNSSAHFFVGHADEGAAVYQSVPLSDTAWHVGAKHYVHPACRNANSIGVELCCHKDAKGRWYFDPGTVTAAQALCRELMAKYRIPRERVLRHYDVTGKDCPAPFVADPAAWQAFLAALA